MSLKSSVVKQGLGAVKDIDSCMDNTVNFGTQNLFSDLRSKMVLLPLPFFVNSKISRKEAF